MKILSNYGVLFAKFDVHYQNVPTMSKLKRNKQPLNNLSPCFKPIVLDWNAKKHKTESPAREPKFDSFIFSHRIVLDHRCNVIHRFSISFCSRFKFCFFLQTSCQPLCAEPRFTFSVPSLVNSFRILFEMLRLFTPFTTMRSPVLRQTCRVDFQKIISLCILNLEWTIKICKLVLKP